MAKYIDITRGLQCHVTSELNKYSEYQRKNRELAEALRLYPEIYREYKSIKSCGSVLSGKSPDDLKPVEYCRKISACHLCNAVRTQKYADQFVGSVEIFARQHLNSLRMKVIPFTIHFIGGCKETGDIARMRDMGERSRRFISRLARSRNKRLENYRNRKTRKRNAKNKLLGPIAISTHIVPTVRFRRYDRIQRRQVSVTRSPRFHLHLRVTTYERATKTDVQRLLEQTLIAVYADTDDGFIPNIIEDVVSSHVRGDVVSYLDLKQESQTDLKAAVRYDAKHTKRNWTPEQTAESIRLRTVAGALSPHRLLGLYKSIAAMPCCFPPGVLGHMFVARTYPELSVMRRLA